MLNDVKFVSLGVTAAKGNSMFVRSAITGCHGLIKPNESFGQFTRNGKRHAEVWSWFSFVFI